MAEHEFEPGKSSSGHLMARRSHSSWHEWCLELPLKTSLHQIVTLPHSWWPSVPFLPGPFQDDFQLELFSAVEIGAQGSTACAFSSSPSNLVFPYCCVSAASQLLAYRFLNIQEEPDSGVSKCPKTQAKPPERYPWLTWLHVSETPKEIFSLWFLPLPGFVMYP